MQIIDTFSGIGGFSYAGSLLGWRTVQFCEMNEFCNKILSYYWPGVPIHTDIKTLTANQIINNGLYDKEETTILTGGVPCQPWSVAGKRKGEEDDRNLWPQTIKLIGSLHPDFAVLENVPGFLTWNKEVFLEQMLTSLEAEGYEVFPVVLPACGVNAPHKRERVWFIAYFKNSDERLSIRTQKANTKFRINGINEFTTNTKKQRFQKRNGEQVPDGTHATIKRHNSLLCWQNFPTQSPLCSRDDGFSSRLDGITFPKWRNESIKAYGNAIVPQVALQIFKAIEEFVLNENKV